jgi:hypothetical protein
VEDGAREDEECDVYEERKCKGFPKSAGCCQCRRCVYGDVPTGVVVRI